jgi:hypothetical protein
LKHSIAGIIEERKHNSVTIALNTYKYMNSRNAN